MVYRSFAILYCTFVHIIILPTFLPVLFISLLLDLPYFGSARIVVVVIAS